jgi:hypothetical protein
MPIYRSRRSEGAWDTSLLLFFAGESKGREYAGFFPFAGKLYERFGKEEISFCLWPLYAHSRDAWGGEKTDVVWPFFSAHGGSEEGFTLWPLYGERERKGEKWIQYVLWPIFFRGQRDLDTEKPRDFFYVFPLYLESTSAGTASYDVLWPFFRYRQKEFSTSYDVPWPFISVSSGEGTKGFKLFPLYWSAESEEDRTLHVLWPIYKRSEKHVGEKRWLEERILLLNRYVEDDRGNFLNVWPLFEYRSSETSASFFFPSIIPYRDARFDRIVRPLLTLYEYRRKGETRLSNLLWGFYTKEEKGDDWKRRLAFLVEVKKEQGRYGFELLSGLFAIDHKRVKVFFIPIPRTDQ